MRRLLLPVQQQFGCLINTLKCHLKVLGRTYYRLFKAMILCVGALGSGKSTLLKVVQQYGQDLEEGASAASSSTAFQMPITTPTVGTDLLMIIRCDK